MVGSPQFGLVVIIKYQIKGTPYDFTKRLNLCTQINSAVSMLVEKMERKKKQVNSSL